MAIPKSISEQLNVEEQPKSAVLPRSISLIKALTLPAIFIVLVEILVRNGVIEPYLLPAPSSLFQSFTELAEGDLWQHI